MYTHYVHHITYSYYTYTYRICARNKRLYIRPTAEKVDLAEVDYMRTVNGTIRYMYFEAGLCVTPMTNWPNVNHLQCGARQSIVYGRCLYKFTIETCQQKQFPEKYVHRANIFGCNKISSYVRLIIAKVN